MRAARWIGMAIAWCGMLGVAGRAVHAADPEIQASLLPVRYIAVKGDDDTFRAQHWMPDGYTGGLKDLSGHYISPDGIEIFGASHALIPQNDYGAALSVKKGDLGFVDVNYTEFRKYYDGTGGSHQFFAALGSFEAPRNDISLDIGKFGVETGLTLEGWPELGVEYEREYKDGAKTHLNWGAVNNGITRNLYPSWQDIDEIVDAITFTAKDDLAGFALSGDQRWEWVRSELVREERFLSSPGAALQKVRRQDIAPESTLMTTTLGAERHFLGDKVLFTSGYHFAHMNNREFESLLEFNAAGTPANFSNPEQKPNSRADNDFDSHSWVGSVMVTPWPALGLTTRLKSEVIKREGNSSYPLDSTTDAPNGIIDRTEVSLSDSKAVRWGESVGLRYTGIPRTALYTELEMEQARVLLREDRQSLDGPDTGNGSSSSEVFFRETVTAVRRGAWTLGGRVDPWRFLDLTSHVRRRINNNDYDDQRESVAAGTALSAFIDEQDVHTNEFAARATLKPCRWLRSSFRYQFRGDLYITRFEAQKSVEAIMRSSTFTYDVVLQPTAALMTTASFSRQLARTSTPARYSGTTVPPFEANVNTWLFSADYAPTPTVGLNGTLQYSTADNFNNDFAAVGLPLGAAYDRLDLTCGLTWALAEDTSVETQYGFYHYQANSYAEFGGYDAHAISLALTKKF